MWLRDWIILQSYNFTVSNKADRPTVRKPKRKLLDTKNICSSFLSLRWMDLLYQIVVDVNLKQMLQSEALLFSIPTIQQYLFLGFIISPTSVAIEHIHSSLDCIITLTVRESVSFSLRRFFFSNGHNHRFIGSNLESNCLLIHFSVSAQLIRGTHH